MGLDYYIVSLPKGFKPQEAIDSELEIKDQVELLYARKAWELVYFLKGSTSELYSPVQKEDFAKLIDLLSVFYGYYDKIVNAEEDVSPAPSDVMMLKEFEDWFDRNFDHDPILGYAFEARTFQRWLEDAQKVFDAFDDPTVDVWQVVSY